MKRADVTNALKSLPLSRDDIVFCHSNIGFFGRIENICGMLFDEILDRVATLVVPTFTYSFANGEIFNTHFSASKMGIFAEWVRSNTYAVRSRDPFYSVAAIGGDADKLVANISNNSFDEDSFFARLLPDGKILNLNFDAGSTFIHYVERQLQVPYRFDKTFTGTIRDTKGDWLTDWTIWVRSLEANTEAAFEKFDALARSQGLFVTAPLGRGEIGVISAKDTADLIQRELPRDPWLLVKQ